MLLHRELLLLLFIGIVSGFRPNHESGGISDSDFTDADITEMGVLRAVAWFMERNVLPGTSPMDPGELENMKPLTPSGLFKAYFEGKKQKTAVLELQSQEQDQRGGGCPPYLL